MRRTRWRRNRLLVLAYHGISLHDEHLWDSNLFIAPDRFRRRMETLRRGPYNVLPLEEALQRAASGDLPPASVAITIDDGLYCFYKTALPILEGLQLPSTLYLTTYHCDNQLPVFNVAMQYLLWRARDSELDLQPVTGAPQRFKLRDASTRRLAFDALLDYAQQRGMSGAAKQELIEKTAAALNIDEGPMRRGRLFHIMTPNEAAECARRGVDIQLHTHRHRVPRNRDEFWREIDDNRRRIQEITGRSPRHFCYPGGVYYPECFAWLRERDVVSATTCDPDLISRRTEAMCAPRLVDVSSLNDTEFDAWLSGLASLLPTRAVPR